jgi:cyclase
MKQMYFQSRRHGQPGRMTRRQVIRALCALPLAGGAVAQTAPAIEAVQLTEEFYMVSGDGGNVGVVIAPNAVMMIDGGFSHRAAELLKAIADHVDSDAVTVLFNTSWHMDHTGCNETLGELGGVRIIAQENVKKRLSKAQTFAGLTHIQQPLKPKGIPSETFAQSGKLTFGAVPVEYVHIPEANSDGDAYLFFPDLNVLHAGDLFFNGFFPSIDYASGGWVGGMAEAARKLLAVGDSATQIIPGHGPMASKNELQSSALMLAEVYERLAPMARQGKTMQEVAAIAPLRDLDAQWGDGPIRPNIFLDQAYNSILRRQPTR